MVQILLKQGSKTFAVKGVFSSHFSSSRHVSILGITFNIINIKHFTSFDSNFAVHQRLGNHVTSTKRTHCTPPRTAAHTQTSHTSNTHINLSFFFVAGRNTASHLLTLKTYDASKHGKRHRPRALTETSTTQSQKTKTLSVPKPTMSCSPACSRSGLHCLLQGLMFQAPMALGQTTAGPPSFTPCCHCDGLSLGGRTSSQASEASSGPSHIGPLEDTEAASVFLN